MQYGKIKELVSLRCDRSYPTTGAAVRGRLALERAVRAGGREPNRGLRDAPRRGPGPSSGDHHLARRGHSIGDQAKSRTGKVMARPPRRSNRSPAGVAIRRDEMIAVAAAPHRVVGSRDMRERNFSPGRLRRLAHDTRAGEQTERDGRRVHEKYGTPRTGRCTASCGTASDSADDDCSGRNPRSATTSLADLRVGRVYDEHTAQEAPECWSTGSGHAA